jgi:hypothetical protein
MLPKNVKSITEENSKPIYESSLRVAPRDKGFNPNLGPDERTNWGGYKLRAMMHCAYMLFFLCMLRFDKILRIKAHHIEILSNEKLGELKLSEKPINLEGSISFRNFRGAILMQIIIEIKPFHLYHNRENIHLDPVHTILRWISYSKITERPLFRHFNKYDQVKVINKKPKLMTQEVFLEYFQHNLLKVWINPVPYGTYFFRRGGC